MRSPYPPSLTPSDTFVVDARAFGDRAGLSYSAEFAYELGRLAIVGGIRDVRAWAATAHVDWQSGLPLRPRFSLGGSYATGEDGSGTSATHRFDPMLPDARSGLGQMGLYAWSNVADGSFSVALAPLDDVTVALGYRYVRLADARGAWFSASLLPVGQNPNNADAFLMGARHDLTAAPLPVVVLVVYAAVVAGAATAAFRRRDVGA